MTARTPHRAAAALLAGALAVTALAACDPVAWARRTPQETATVPASAPLPTSAVPTSAAPTTAVTTTGSADCASDGPAVTRLRSVAYSALPDRSVFTRAVAAAAGRVVTAGAATVAFHDFMPADDTEDGGVLGPAAIGLIGAGEGRTILQVAPHTSTRASDIPSGYPHTNQLDVMRVTGAASTLEGFTVQGTDQGHLYNGLRIDRVHDLRAARIRVVGIPGDDSSPPGETFGINDFKTVGSQWSDITVDGAGVGASGFGVNGSRDIRICGTVSERNTHAMGFAFWQSSGIRLVDCRALDNGFSGFNFERVSGTNTLVRPIATGNRYGMRIASDRSSARFTIVDPQLTGGTWTVTLPKRFLGKPNLQRRSDIRLVIGGKDRPDLLRFRTT